MLPSPAAPVCEQPALQPQLVPAALLPQDALLSGVAASCYSSYLTWLHNPRMARSPTPPLPFLALLLPPSQLASFMEELETSGLLKDAGAEATGAAVTGAAAAAGSSSKIDADSSAAPPLLQPATAVQGTVQGPEMETEQAEAEAEQKVLGYLRGNTAWSKVLDTGSSTIYYWNLSSNEVTWEAPEGLDGEDLMSVEEYGAAGATEDAGTSVGAGGPDDVMDTAEAAGDGVAGPEVAGGGVAGAEVADEPMGEEAAGGPTASDRPPGGEEDAAAALPDDDDDHHPASDPKQDQGQGQESRQEGGAGPSATADDASGDPVQGLPGGGSSSSSEEPEDGQIPEDPAALQPGGGGSGRTH